MTGPADRRRGLFGAFLRFACVGVLNSTIDVALFGLLNASLGIVCANFVSTTAGMTFSFVANGRHTFGVRQVTRYQVALFLSANAVTMWLLQPLLIVTGTQAFGVPLVAAKILALGATVVSNFVLYRYVVWPPATLDPASRSAGRMPATVVAPR